MDLLDICTELPFGQDLPTDIFVDDLDPFMTLSSKVNASKNFNIGHNLLISEWIYFILVHNTPLDNTSPLTYIYISLTLN